MGRSQTSVRHARVRIVMPQTKRLKSLLDLSLASVKENINLLSNGPNEDHVVINLREFPAKNIFNWRAPIFETIYY